MNIIKKAQFSSVIILIFLFNSAYAEEPAVNSVLANVNGQEITLGEIIMAVSNLPEEYDNVNDKQLEFDFEYE